MISAEKIKIFHLWGEEGCLLPPNNETSHFTLIKVILKYTILTPLKNLEAGMANLKD